MSVRAKRNVRRSRILDLSKSGSLTLLIAAAALLAGGCKCRLVPWALAVDPSLTGNSDADGVLEPFETVIVEPSWQEEYTGPCTRTGKYTYKCDFGPGEFYCAKLSETGAPASLTGPDPGTYVVQPSPWVYETIDKGITKSGAYAVFVSPSTGRPAPHWDATFAEDLTGTHSASKAWTLHVGDSFWDVPRSHPFYAKIETLFHNAITSGCAPGGFCPDAAVSRSQVAVFLARALAGGGANIPDQGVALGRSYRCASPGSSAFVDVAPTDSFCKHIHYLASRGVVDACDGESGRFCPGRSASRDSMAALVAKAIALPTGAVPITYGPDAATGRSYSCQGTGAGIHFTDVPQSDASCKFAHYLWAKGVIAGCGPDTFCPEGDVARGEMAKFLVNAFQLKLYGS